MSHLSLMENQGIGSEFISRDDHEKQRWRVQIKTESGYIWHDLSDKDIMRFSLQCEGAARQYLPKWQADDMRLHFIHEKQNNNTGGRNE